MLNQLRTSLSIFLSLYIQNPSLEPSGDAHRVQRTGRLAGAGDGPDRPPGHLQRHREPGGRGQALPDLTMASQIQEKNAHYSMSAQ
jgi:hypothetical protein